MSEPIAYADLWRAVMEAAGFRCQCTGECGNKHAKSRGRCPREHDQHASRHRGPVRLTAAPANPATGARAAAQLPVSALRAWCPDCHDAARRAVSRETRSAADPAQNALFDLPN
ncbi:hypothetical protein [Streptomyces sp. NPDC048172]|uniref:hypothetical protein n=1 Tax=Streptomyces sp. NPDC048172 TaxID=3365505 RepID=UPI00371F4A85